ncbi:MAG TPA: hypothetical protein VF581_00165 [Flavobacterium sp.]|jgi:hypothetical protein
MKLNLKYLSTGLGLLFSGMFLVSCEQDTTEFVSGAGDKPMVTLVGGNSYTVAEGEALPLTFTLDRASAEPIVVKIDMVDENGNLVDLDAEEDFAIGEGDPTTISAGYGVNGYLITIPANVTTYTFNFNPTLDAGFEESETYRFRIGSVGFLRGNVDPASEFIDVTITNAVSDQLHLTFDFDATFNVGGTDYSLCEEGYDVDFIVYDADYTDLEVFDAQTGACPEELTMDLNDYEDGTYHITAFLYDNIGVSDAGISPAQNFPITVSYSRGGSATMGNEGGTFVQDNAFTSDSVNDDEVYVMTVVIANGTFTIMDMEQTIVSGRHAAPAGKVKKAPKF